MTFSLRVRNYRGLRDVVWAPSGVCALVGPNGSGKTTLLDVPQMLGDALDRGLRRALEERGSLDGLTSFAAGSSEDVEFEIGTGDVSWHMIPYLVKGSGLRPMERVLYRGLTLVTRERGDDDAQIDGKATPARDTLAAGIAMESLTELAPLRDLLTRYRLYGDYNVREARRIGSVETTERRLERRGENVFSVLRNWNDRRDDKARLAFVIDGLRQMFPFFDDLEFAKASQLIVAEYRVRPWDRLLSASVAPEGWFVALMHLTAIASTEPADVISFDELENALHPHAIHILIEKMREWSRRHGVTMLLATHSPVIISAFNAEPENLYVMEPDRPQVPIAIDQLKDPDWLAHFALGDLYIQDEFGAPHGNPHRPDHDRRL